MSLFEAKVLSINDIVEEEVLLDINDLELACFCSWAGPAVHVKPGDLRRVSVEMSVLDEYTVEEADDD